VAIATKLKKVEVDKKAEKAAAVERITTRLRESSTAVLADYRGLTVAQMLDLRRKLRGAGVEMVVVKNTLARRAAEAAGIKALQKELVGPVAMAFAGEDLSAPARLLSEYIRANRRMVIKSGILQGQVIDAETVAQLAELPSREVLISRLLGTMQAPLGTLARALEAPLSKLARTLEALRVKKGEPGDGSAPRPVAAQA